MVTKVALGLGISLISGVAYAMPAVVDYVIDGDTFGAHVLVSDDINVDVRVRIANIDAPEIHGRCEFETMLAHRARDRLAELLPIGEFVDLTDIRDDKYLGRIDARVIHAKHGDVGRVMMTENLARKYDGGHRDGWCD